MTPEPLLIVGIVLGLGFFGSKLVARLKAPQILGSMLIGLCLGPALAGLWDAQTLRQWGELVVPFTLSMIGFGIGSEMKIEVLKKLGRSILLIAVCESLATFVLVAGAVLLVAPRELALPLAILLASLAVATAPTTTAAMLRELKASGPVTTTMLAVIGIDDVIGLLAFAVALPLAASILGDASKISTATAVIGVAKEILISPLVGLVIGWLLSQGVKQLRNRGEVLIVTLSALAIAAGLSRQFNLSVLLVTLSAGMTLTNRNRIVANRVYESLGAFMPPFYVLFFALVGANIQPVHLKTIGLVGVLYCIARCLGKWLGALGGARLAGADPEVRRYLGLGLLSQGGVAMALALSASRRLSEMGGPAAEMGQLCLTVIASSTLVLFFLGPPAIKYAIGRVGEAQKAKF